MSCGASFFDQTKQGAWPGCLLLAADLWAQVRQSGLPTGDPKKLDIDVILAAQVLSLSYAPSEIVLAPSSTRHLSRFTPAKLWEHIRP